MADEITVSSSGSDVADKFNQNADMIDDNTTIDLLDCLGKFVFLTLLSNLIIYDSTLILVHDDKPCNESIARECREVLTSDLA
jgi:hypothetical protein